MISFEEARTRVLSLAVRSRTSQVPIESSAGFVLARAVSASLSQPRFDNSGVDGFAIHERDLSGNTELLLRGQIQAGDVGDLVVTPGTTVRVMTGAPVPSSSAAVVMQEDTELVGDRVHLKSSHSVGENIRHKGREIEEGQVMVSEGTIVSAPVLSALASNGTKEVTVCSKPNVGLLVTGNELAYLGQDLEPGQLYESNSHALRSMLEPLSNRLDVERVQDSLCATEAAIERLLESADVVITTGGVSVGSFDFVRPALTGLGFEFLVPKVSMKPGKPFCCATRADGKVAFGLPGNPMSALTTFALFVWPWLRRFAGVGVAPSAKASLGHALDNRGDRDHFMAGVVTLSEGRAIVSALTFVGSHAVGGMMGSNAILRAPAEAKLDAGTLSEIFPVPWEAWC